MLCAMVDPAKLKADSFGSPALKSWLKLNDRETKLIKHCVGMKLIA